jgi:dolichol-phosphate mannosyltransferase
MPTYNEKENIEGLVSEIFRYVSDVNILIVDDNSPDGTGAIADKIADKDRRVSVLHRISNRGRGLAGIEAFKKAIKREDVKYIIEMDADFSHDPKYIPIFLKEIENSDVVIGSRYVNGAMDCDRGRIRVILSKLVNLFIRKYLGLDIKDCSSGYRCFRKEALTSLDLDKMISKEPSIIEEVLYKCKLKNYKIKEVPIIFKNRRGGKTKLGVIKLIKVLRDIIIIRASPPPQQWRTRRELKRFGFNLALGLNILGCILFYRHKEHFIWFSTIGSIVLILSIMRPEILAPVKRLLDKLIFIISWLTTSIGLLMVFYLIFTPVAILLKISGRDLLHQKIDKSTASYWIKRKQMPFSKESYERLG